MPILGPGPGRSPVAVIGSCVAAALLLAGWLLWTRADPSRQGGYCANATIAVAELLEQPTPSGPDEPDPLQPSELVTDAGDVAARLQARRGGLEVARLRVRTPAAVRADVAVLEARPAGPEGAEAFGRILDDYRRRCLYQG